jgi:hypothetical protein
MDKYGSSSRKFPSGFGFVIGSSKPILNEKSMVVSCFCRSFSS